METYTQKDILNKLDEAGTDPYNFWFDLEAGYFCTAGSRITLFGDENKWAVVFEKAGYDNKGMRIAIELTYFGNCLNNLEKAGSDDQFTCNSKYLSLVDEETLDAILNERGDISKNAKTIKIRDTFINIQHNLKNYQSKNIVLGKDENDQSYLDIESVTRYLDEQNVQLFRATESELRQCLPQGLPKLFVIDKWYHNRYTFGYTTKPSQNETFQLIADIIVKKDTSLWKPTLKPNNDWRNWPDAGSL